MWKFMIMMSAILGAYFVQSKFYLVETAGPGEHGHETRVEPVPYDKGGDVAQPFNEGSDGNDYQWMDMNWGAL
uniref:Uncharacterized protein n=1 Tax=Pseudodiaptomus poplesia TaxID=213370 RepID=A0A0U2V6V7_9MAXI|nr:hypothetical protein [Pseudodiaptomus poplesia]